MQDLGNTQFFRVETDNTSVKEILSEVYQALTEKGYNPVNQAKESKLRPLFSAK